VVSLPASSLRILSPEQEVLQQAATEQEERFIGQHHCMAGLVTWGVLRAIYVGADDTIEVSPPDHKPELNASFVNTFNIVGGPGYGVGDAWVDAHRSEEGTSVLYMGTSGAQEHSETNYTKEADEDIAQTTLMCPVSDKANKNGYNSSHSVWRSVKSCALVEE